MQNKDLVLQDTNLKRRIALGAIYGVLRQKNNNTLTGEQDFSFKKATMESLEQFWGVPTRKWVLSDLFFSRQQAHPPMLELLNWFAVEGHRKADNTPPSIAWDVARYVDVLRDAFYVGYINQETVLKHLDIAYNISIGHFWSWKAYGLAFLEYKRAWDESNMADIAQELNYTLGRFPSQEEVQETYDKQGFTPIMWLDDAVESLLNDPKSIWSQVAW